MKWIAWLLSISTVLCGWYLVSSDSRQHSAPGAIRLVLAVGTLSDRAKASLKVKIDRFRDSHPNVEVEIREVAGDYYQNLLIMLAGRVAPDLMWMGADFGSFADRGVFLDITDRISGDPDVDLSGIHTDMMRWYRSADGRQLGVPVSISTGFIAYNKTLFDEMGVPYPSDDWTFDDFVDKAQRLTLDRNGDGRTDQYGYRGGLEPEQFGAQFISDDGLRAMCETPEMIEFVRTNVELAHRYKVMPSPDITTAEMEGLDTYSFFRQRRAAMMDFYTPHLPYMIEKFADMDWDIALRPHIPGRLRQQWATSAAFLIWADTPHPHEAWALCKVLFDARFQPAALADGSIPADDRALRAALAQPPEKPANLPALAEIRDRLRPTPRVPNLAEAGEIWWRACQGAWSGRQTPEQSMAQAQAEIERMIARWRRDHP